MHHPRRKRLVTIGLVVSGVLAATALAYAAATRGYHGRTSQHQPISFHVAGGYLRSLDYKIIDRCPNGQRLINHDYGFTPIRIRRSHFGGTFLDPLHHGKAVVKGSIKHHVARGTLLDRTRDPSSHRICTGTATFTLARR
jgi:hypothetical protein